MGFALKTEHLPHYTYDDYCKWEGKWELIEGVPYAMTPLPSIKHQRVNGFIYAQLLSLLAGCRNCEVLMPVDWKVNENTVLQPDVSVICKPIMHKNYLNFAPAVVFEIISPSSAVKDRNVKFEIYQNEKVRYYVLVDAEQDGAEVFELVNETYVKRIETNKDVFTFNLDKDCKVQFDFAQIWVT